MFGYSIINTPVFEIDKKTIDKILTTLHTTIKKKQKGILNIVFLDGDSIKDLNNKYRKIDKITDVLSFHYFDNFEEVKDFEVAGEIILCEKKILEQGREHKLGSEKEFYKLLTHSVLHILGYDHEKNNDYTIMQGFEKRIWEEVFEK